MNATQLLIKLYQEENARYGVRFEKGILQDVERPLLPKLSYLITKYANEEEVEALAAGPTQKSVSNLGTQSEMAGSAHSAAKEESKAVSVAEGQQPSQVSSKSKASRILRMALQAAN